MVLNGGEIEALPSSYWYLLVRHDGLTGPKALEIRLVTWSI
jgi:hypothetical protein